MRVILKTDVADLGKAGDVVDVEDSHVRHFLIPQRLAVELSEADSGTDGTSRLSAPSAPWWGWLLALTVGLPLSVAAVASGGFAAWSALSKQGMTQIDDPLAVPALHAIVEGGVPVELLSAYDHCSRSGRVPPTCSVLPLLEKTGWEGTIGMATVESLEGLWSGTGARLTVGAPYDRMMPADSREEEWDRLMGISPRSAQSVAWIRVRVSPPSAGHLHAVVPARAILDVTAPYGTGTSAYSNRSWTVERDLEFIVISEAEMSTLEEVYHRSSEGDVAAVVLFGALLVLLGIAVAALTLSGLEPVR